MPAASTLRLLAWLAPAAPEATEVVEEVVAVEECTEAAVPSSASTSTAEWVVVAAESEDPPVTAPAAAAVVVGAAEPGSSAERPDWPAREQRARAAGKSARAKVEGLIRVVPRTPALGGGLDDRRCFVVVRSGIASVPERGLYPGGYRGIKGYVEDSCGRLRPGAVFHGFASQREARAYWQAAVGEEPWPILSARP